MSPPQVAISPGKGCARASIVHGLPAQLVAGNPVPLRVVVADEHGNPTTSGGDAVVVTADSAGEGSAAVPVQVCPSWLAPGDSTGASSTQAWNASYGLHVITQTFGHEPGSC